MGGLNDLGSLATLGLFDKKNGMGVGYKPVDLNAPLNDNLQKIQGQVDSMQAPTALQAYSAKDMSKTDMPEFTQARNQTTQRLNAKNQGDQSSMERRFAAMGGLNSGAYVKASQMQDQQSNETTANAMNEIGAQEAQARRGLQTAEDNKAFQSGESTKQFNANQSNHFNEFKIDANSKLAQMDMGYKQMQQQQSENAYQADLNAFQAKHTGGLLGSGGVLGTGIGV